LSESDRRAVGRVRPILRYDVPAEAQVLRRRAEPVARVTRSVAQLIDDMLATMYHADGVGLAAPQIGVSRRVIVGDVGDGPLGLVNPEIVRRSEERETAFEGCLSIPDLMGEVARHKSVYVTGLDRRGRKVWVEAEGFLARAIQHEIDHLDGILILDRAERIVEIPKEKRLKIVFMGTPEFAVPVLERLIDDGFKVRAVVTRPDRPAGRGQRLRPSPVKEAAEAHGLEVLQPERASDPAFLARLDELEPDVIVTCAFGMILPKGVLEKARVAALNVHASLLPRHRGAAPIQHALMAGDTETGITVFYMDEGMDTGDILYQRPLAIEPDDTSGTLHRRLSVLAAEALPEALRLLVSDDPPRRPQDHSRATYAPRLTAGDERVRWEEPAERVAGRIRALDPWPGAVTTWRGRPLKLFAASVAEGDPPPGTAPGTVLAAGAEHGLVVAAGRGAVTIREVQAPGGRRMPVGDFLNGHPLRPGDLLGAGEAGDRSAGSGGGC